NSAANRSRGAIALPCFRLLLPEDSLFLPRCGHGAGSHFALGAGKWGDCQMMIKASGRSALILATGFFVFFAGPTPVVAASSDSAMTAKGNTMLLAAADKPAEVQGAPDTPVVASDQLNELDRAVQQSPATQTVALAVTRPTPTTPVQASSNDTSAWDQTSLIG